MRLFAKHHIAAEEQAYTPGCKHGIVYIEQYILNAFAFVNKNALLYAKALSLALIIAEAKAVPHGNRSVSGKPAGRYRPYGHIVLIHKHYKFPLWVAHGVVIPGGELMLAAVAMPGVAAAGFADYRSKAVVRHYVYPGQRRRLARLYLHNIAAAGFKAAYAVIKLLGLAFGRKRRTFPLFPIWRQLERPYMLGHELLIKAALWVYHYKRKRLKPCFVRFVKPEAVYYMRVSRAERTHKALKPAPEVVMVFRSVHANERKLK